MGVPPEEGNASVRIGSFVPFALFPRITNFPSGKTPRISLTSSAGSFCFSVPFSRIRKARLERQLTLSADRLWNRESQITVLVALPTQLAIVLSVECGKFRPDHLQCQFDGLKLIHASSIFDPLTTNARYLKWTVLVVSKSIGQRLGLAHFHQNTAAGLIRKKESARCHHRSDRIELHKPQW